MRWPRTVRLGQRHDDGPSVAAVDVHLRSDLVDERLGDPDTEAAALFRPGSRPDAIVAHDKAPIVHIDPDCAGPAVREKHA
jgi:hypothetical protein